MSSRTIHRSIGSAVLLLALLLTACGATPQTNAPTAVPQAEPTAALQAEPTAQTNQQPAGEQVVYVYSARHYGPMEATFSKFTAETGIEVRLSQGSVQSLLERLRAEGKQSPADVFFSIDAGGLALAAEEGLLRPIQSPALEQAIPAELRDPQGRWFGLTQRVRTIVYHPDRVNPEELSTYAGLADPKWKGRLCLRPSSHIYTLSLVSSLIAADGREGALQTVQGWVANEPQFIDSDSQILSTIAAGGCDVAITNHYYLGQALAKDPAFPVKVFWANQDDRGVHRNISGMGVTAAARHPENAQKLIEWLATTGQGASAEDTTALPGGNNEFPANPQAPTLARIAAFGTFKTDPLPLAEYGKYQPEAVKLLQEAGYK